MRLALIRSMGALLALSVGIAGSAQAQAGSASDASGIGAAGAGLSGALGIGAKPPMTPEEAIVSSVANAAAGFENAPAGGVSVGNPATGTSMIVPQDIASALARVLRGQSTGVAPLTAALTAGGSVPAGAAGALAQSLLALGTSPTFANLVAAINAYNNAVNAMTGAVPPALLAVRHALQKSVSG